MIKFVARSATGLVLFALVLAAQAQITPNTPLPVSPNVVVGKLPNGLTYYLQKNGRPEKKLELRLVIKAGSILEDDDQQGMAHLLEHMAFNGTTNFKKQELVSYLESIGVQFGADLNAYTSFDETVYILPIPTHKREHIEKGFLVLRDWAGGMSLNAKDIDDERPVVLEELRIGKGARDRMNKVLLPKLFNGSRYAQRLPIGTDAVIRNGSHAALRRFYQDWYRPDLMAVVVVGDIETADAERLVKQHFADLKMPAKPRPRFDTEIAARSATEALVITDKEANGNSLLIRFPVQRSTESVTYGGYRNDMVKSLFTTMLNQRLQELTQLANPPFLGASSAVSGLTKRYEAYSASAQLGKGGAAPAIDALVQENARASQFGFSAAELERAKKSMQRQVDRAYNERDKTNSSALVSELIRNFLENESIAGVENEYKYATATLPGITLEEVNQYARATIPLAAPKLVAYMGATKAELPTPTSEQLLAMYSTAEKLAVTAREEKAVATSLMAKLPAPGMIVSESQDKALGTTTLVLSNGVKVVLKPTDFRNDQVLLGASRHGGLALFDDAELFNARYASGVASAMGLGAFAPVELRKILAGKSASVAGGIGASGEALFGTSGSADIETMLQQLHLKMGPVRRDPELFKSFVGKQAEAARNTMVQPDAVFQDAIVGALYNNHPRVARAPKPEQFAALDLDRLAAIQEQRFSSVKDMTFILVGSFDVAAVKPLIATYIASLPAGEIDTRMLDRGVRPVKGVVKKQVRVGAEDKSKVSITFTGDAAYSPAEQLRLAAMLEVMNIKVVEVLREKLSLIYGGGFNGAITRVPYANYRITMTVPTGPANVDKVIAAAFGEIERLKTEGPSVADLNKVKEGWMTSHRRAMRENGYWMSRLISAAMMEDDAKAILDYEARVNAITQDDVKAAAKRYFDMQNYLQVVQYPAK
jgi:zinc protease